MSAADLSILRENAPGELAYSQASFIGRLTEEAVFDLRAYRMLEEAIVTTAALPARDRGESAKWAFRIFDRVTLLLVAQFDPSDVFRIVNMEKEVVRDFAERFRYVMGCWFAAESPELSRFAPVVLRESAPGSGGESTA